MNGSIGAGVEASVEARGLVLGYQGRVVVAASDFSAAPGTVVAVIGPNGSGKSTLLHAVAGLAEPLAGSVRVFGSHPRQVHRRIAYVLQSNKVNDLMPVTVREVVAMGRYAQRGMFGRLRRADHAAIDAVVERLGIAALAGRHLRELSGGQRQRVFVAQGLVQEGDVLLLDEPLTGLDLVSHEIIDEVVAEERAAGRTVMITTHDIAEARRSDHVLLLAGRVVAQGPPGEVLTPERMAEAYGAQLLHADHGGHADPEFDEPHHH